MKTKRLVIKEPCSEAWSEMTPKEDGRHCAKCDKVVVDLTSTDVRTAFRLVNESGKSMCVQLLPEHLDYRHVETHNPVRPDFSLKAVAMGAALLTFASLNSCASNRDPVRGKVRVVTTTPVSAEQSVPEKAQTPVYRVAVKDGRSNAISDAYVTVLHGEQTDSLQTGITGKCSFRVIESEFRVVIDSPYYIPQELTQKDFHAGKAQVELEYIPIVGEVSVEE